MTLQVSKNKPIFPNMPRSTKSVDANGNFTAQWSLSLNSLFQTLQNFFSNEGFGLPEMTLEEQNSIEADYQRHIGQLLPQNLRDISGRRIIDSPTYDGVTPRVPKVFIIEYNTNRTVRTAEWKSYPI